MADNLAWMDHLELNQNAIDANFYFATEQASRWLPMTFRRAKWPVIHIKGEHNHSFGQFLAQRVATHCMARLKEQWIPFTRRHLHPLNVCHLVES